MTSTRRVVAALAVALSTSGLLALGSTEAPADRARPDPAQSTRSERQQERRGETRREGSGERTREGAGRKADNGREEQGAKPAAPPAKEDAKLTLERLFPEKGLFGSVPTSPAFSHDGRYGAFLYRPHVERRHGNDLWIHDFENGTTRRVTMVSVMSAFQEDARKVRDDRVKKVKAKKKADGPAARGAGGKAREEGDGGEGGEEGAGQTAAAPAPDPISGTWSGEATVEETDLLPPDGAEVTFELRRGEGDALSGVVKSAFGTVAIAEGVFEVETGRLAGTLRFEQRPVTARLEATLAEGTLTGEISIDGSSGVVRFTATRIATAEGDPSAKGAAAAAPEAASDDDDENAIVRFTARDLGDWVDDKDADDEKAPRYGGVSSFEWSPVADRLIFTAAGDLYLLEPADESIERLTRSREDERGVDWLPDGTGFTYVRSDDQRGDQVIRIGLDAVASGVPASDVTDATPEAPVAANEDAAKDDSSAAGAPVRSACVEELNPRLPQGERMTGYRLSPDGRRLVMVASKGDSRRSGRQVTIVNYRERFAQAQQVARTVSDDPLPEIEDSVYLYDLGEQLSERGPLRKVYSRTRSGPRDVLQVPEWAPDSSRVAFAVFDQATGNVEILEATFEAVEPDEKKDGAAKDGDASAGTAEGKGDEGGDDGEGNGRDRDDDGDGDLDAETQDGNGGSSDKDEEADSAQASKGPPRSFEDLEAPPDDPEPAFEIQDARPVYRFLHNGGPNTPRLIEPHYLPDSRRMVFLTELSGFRQLHVLDPVYEALQPLTQGRFEVYPFDISRDHRRLFVFATREDPAQQHVYEIDLDAGDQPELRRLSPREGFYDGAAVSDDGRRLLALHTDYASVRDLHAIDAEKGRDVRLTDAHPDEAKALTSAVPERFTYRNRHGHEIQGQLFRPDDWTPNDQRPLLIYVYGGPLGQRKLVTRGAVDAASYLFAMYMAKVHGYVTCTIDPRGVSGYGGLFEKSNYEQVGKPQVEDLVDGVKWLVEHCAVDPKRVGIHGWSFGGFQTQMCLYTEPEVFAVGIAGAGPTEWENYNAWYSTGTIGPSRTGQTDLAKFSLLPLAKKLKGRLLLVHGVEDSNVLYQDTVRVYRELLKAGKEALVDLFIDPTGGHGLGGDVKTINRYRKYEDFLVTHLGKGVTAPPMGPPVPSSEGAEAEPALVAMPSGAAAE